MRHKRHFATATFDLYCTNQRSEHTATNAHYRLLSFARWLEETHHITELESVKTEHVLGYKKHLADSGLAASSQARTIETLRGFFRFCYAEHLIARDPAAQVKSPRPLRGKEPQYLTTPEARRLITAAEGRRNRAIAWIFNLGLRVGEVKALDVADLVLPDRQNKIPMLKVRGKGSLARTLPLSDKALHALRQYLKTREDVNPDAPLFACRYAGESERRFSRRGLQTLFAQMCQRAGIDESKRHPHSARHGAAQRWLFEGKVNLFVVSRLLGHSSVSTTQLYLRLDKTALVEAVMRDPLAR